MNVRIRISLLLLALPLVASGQQPLTLQEAVNRSTATYPAIRSSMEQVAAAAEGINLARTAFLPRADFMGQLNRATHNNIFGLVLPQSVIPSISGPVLGTNSLSNVWGSAVGALVTWEPIDFGLRKANVETAQAARNKAAAEVNVTKLQVAVATADAFLTIAAAEQTVIAARAGVERGLVLDDVIGTLAKNELRPGADASRSQAELALARNLLIQAEQSRDVARAALAQLLAATSESISIDAAPVLGPPPAAPPPAANAAQHPLALASLAQIDEVKAREKALNRSYYPRLYLQGADYARGTGIQPDGRTGGAASGLGPNIQNWALGASIAFPAFDFFSIRAKKEIEAHNERSAAARYDQTLQDVTGQIAKAKAVLDGARRVAENTPIQLSSARATEQQATARYRAGLGNITEVAEAQRLLTQAEIDDSLARLGVWRALLGVAAAEGDLAPFLASIGK
ncbi:MAG TPA: TolC family protein [Bryobacteraceae bacterium]|nr:TolC family protein [Bryobacteraceae bacterium]